MYRKKGSEQTGSVGDASREYNSLYPENLVHSVQYTNKYKEKSPSNTRSGLPIAQMSNRQATIQPVTDDIILNAPASKWSHVARVDGGSHSSGLEVGSNSGDIQQNSSSRRSRNVRYGTQLPKITNSSSTSTTNKFPTSTTPNTLDDTTDRSWRYQSKLELEGWGAHHTPLVESLQQSVESVVRKWREQHGRYGLKGDNEEAASETAVGWGSAGENIRLALQRVQEREPGEELSHVDKKPGWVNDGQVLKQQLQSQQSGSEEQLLWLQTLETVTQPTTGDSVYGQCPSAAQRGLQSTVCTQVRAYVLAVQYSSGELMHRVETLLSIGNINAKHTQLQQDVQRNTLTVQKEELDREIEERLRWERFVDEARQESLQPRLAAEGHGLTDVTVVDREGKRQVVPASEVEKYITEHDLARGGEAMQPESVWREGRLSETHTGPPEEVQRWLVVDELQSSAHGNAVGTAQYVEEQRGLYDKQGNEQQMEELADIQRQFLHTATWKSEDVLRQMVIEQQMNATKPAAVAEVEDYGVAQEEHVKTQNIISQRKLGNSEELVTANDMSQRIAHAFAPAHETSGKVLLPQLHQAQASALALRNNRALLVKLLSNGEPLTGVIFSASHYYRLPLSRDDYRAVVVVSQQHPLASNNNYLSVFYRYGAPPTADKYALVQSTHAPANVSFVRQPGATNTDQDPAPVPHVDPAARRLAVAHTTQEYRGRVAVSSQVDASISSLASFQITPHPEGKDVYIRISGAGDAVKKYQISVRVIPFIPDFGSAIEKLVDDMDQQREWREHVTDKIRALTMVKDIYDTNKAEKEDELREQLDLERRRRKAAKKHKIHLQRMQEVERQNSQQMSD